MILVTWATKTQSGTGVFLAPVPYPEGTRLLIIPTDSDIPIEVSLADVRFPGLVEGRKHIKREIKKLRQPKIDTETT